LSFPAALSVVLHRGVAPSVPRPCLSPYTTLFRSITMEFVPRPADPDEVRQGKQLIHILPRQDLSQSVRAGDEEQLGVRTVASSQIAQRVDGVGGPGPVDIDA